MTISTTSNQISYTGDGVSIAFAFPYPFIATTDLKVYVGGVLQTSGYSVAGTVPISGSGAYATGTVTFVSAPAVAAVVLVYCDPDALQSTSIPANDPFPAKTVERMVDKLTLLVQRITARLATALVFPLGETNSGILPAAAVRANTSLGFDSSGNPTVLTPASGSAADVLTRLANAADVAKGDALLGVKSTLTGATARTQHAKNADLVTVEDFCNGVTAADGVDFTAYIQAAVDSGAKRIDFTQTGTYYFSDVTIPAGVTVNGRGVARIKLKPFSGTIGTGFHAFFKASSAARITVVGFVCDGNVSAQAADAPNIDRYAGFYFEDCDNLDILWNSFAVVPYGNASIRVRQGSQVNILHNTVTDKGIYYNAYSGSQYSVSIDNNSTIGCGIAINDDTATQHLYGWSISNNRIRTSNALNEAGIGARASAGVIRGNTVLGGYFGMTISAGGATFQQHDVIVEGNYIAADSGSFNPYGIEHFAYDITIQNNHLVNCAIVSSSATGRNIKIRGNLMVATLAAAATDAAISLSSGVFTNVEVSGNTAQGHGSFCFLSCVTESLNVSHNTATLTDYAGASLGIKLENAGAAARTLDGAVIMGNQIRGASKAWLHLIGNGANTLTVNDMRAVFNPTLGSTTGLLVDATASLGATSMHAFNENVYSTFQNTPTAAPAGTGAVWRDAADANRLKMVP